MPMMCMKVGVILAFPDAFIYNIFTSAIPFGLLSPLVFVFVVDIVAFVVCRTRPELTALTKEARKSTTKRDDYQPRAQELVLMEYIVS